MAHLDLGHASGSADGMSGDPADVQVQRTQVMLVITAVASISIIVVAMLFMSLL